MITRRTVLCLGTAQLVSWGISFYLIGVFGELIVADLGWSRALVYGGFSIALLAMGFASPVVGRLIDRFGGRPVMAGGSILAALGCAGLGITQSPVTYCVFWVFLGLAMRATLYDAAFAALARIAGTEARRPMAQVTLLGGLAATFFWPIGHGLAEAFGWRAALLVYAGFALVTVPLHLAVPRGRQPDSAPDTQHRTAQHPSRRRDRAMTAFLYGLIVALTNGLNSGMSAHMISVLTALGLAASTAVSISSLRGIGQSAARLAEILFGDRLHPVDLNLMATLALPVCFAVGLASGESLLAAATLAFFYGAGNGILSITRGTMPLMLFDLRTYGAFVGTLLFPSFVVSAVAPIAFAAVIEHFDAEGALYLSIALSSVILAASLGLRSLSARLDGPRD